MHRVQFSSKWQKIIATCIAAVAMCGGVISSTPVLAQDPNLVAAAKKEGELFIYGDHVHLPPLIEGFKKKYPEIKVQFASYGGWDSYRAYLREAKAGKFIASLIYTGEDALMAASDDGSLQKFIPSSAPQLHDWAVVNGGASTQVHGVMLGILYNEPAMQGLPIPKDWTDFINPPKEWQNLIIFADPRNSSLSYSLVAGLYQFYGPEKGAQIFQGLKNAGVEISPNAGPQTTKMMSGERPLTLTLMTGYLADMLKSGAPVKMIVPTSGANPQFVGMAVTAGAPHPNAAKLFIEHSVSPEGQAALVATGVYGTRLDAATPQGMPDLNTSKLMPTNMRKAIDDRDAIIQWWVKSSGME